jgi:hypothetical protein
MGLFEAATIKSWATPAGLIAQTGATAYGIAEGIAMSNQAKKIDPKYYQYGDPKLQGYESPYAKQMMGLAQTQLNARSPYAVGQQRSILASQAGAQASGQKAITDPSQLLAMSPVYQGVAGQQEFNRAAQEQQQYQQKLAQLTGAQQVMTTEGDKIYQDRLRKYQMDMDLKQALAAAGRQTTLSSMQNLASTFLAAGSNYAPNLQGGQQQQISSSGSYGSGFNVTQPSFGYTPTFRQSESDKARIASLSSTYGG